MKNDRRTAQQLLPVHTRSPEAYMFLGVRMKILLSSKDTGGQFSLIEGLMPPGGDGGLALACQRADLPVEPAAAR